MIIPEVDSMSFAYDLCLEPDGVWTSWQSWGTCSDTCGDSGVQVRERSCVMSSDGVTSADDCVGDEQQARECNRFECPGKNDFLDKTY